MVSVSTTTESISGGGSSATGTPNSGDISLNAYLLQGDLIQIQFAMASQLLKGRGAVVCRSTEDVLAKSTCLMNSDTAIFQILMAGTK